MNNAYDIFESINIKYDDVFGIIFKSNSHTMIPNNAGYPTPVLLQSKCRLKNIISDERFVAEMFDNSETNTLLLVLSISDVIICKHVEHNIKIQTLS